MTEDEMLEIEAAELATKRRLQRGICIWRGDDRDVGVFGTECGRSWETHGDGSPKERGMEFCCYCGLSLVEELTQ